MQLDITKYCVNMDPTGCDVLFEGRISADRHGSNGIDSANLEEADVALQSANGLSREDDLPGHGGLTFLVTAKEPD